MNYDLPPTIHFHFDVDEKLTIYFAWPYHCFIFFSFLQLYQNWFQSVIIVIFVSVLSHSILFP